LGCLSPLSRFAHLVSVPLCLPPHRAFWFVELYGRDPDLRRGPAPVRKHPCGADAVHAHNGVGRRCRGIKDWRLDGVEWGVNMGRGLLTRMGEEVFPTGLFAGWLNGHEPCSDLKCQSTGPTPLPPLVPPFPGEDTALAPLTPEVNQVLSKAVNHREELGKLVRPVVRMRPGVRMGPGVRMPWRRMINVCGGCCSSSPVTPDGNTTCHRRHATWCLIEGLGMDVGNVIHFALL